MKTVTIRVDIETLDRLKRLTETCGGLSIASIVATLSFSSVKELMACGFIQARAVAEARRFRRFRSIRRRSPEAITRRFRGKAPDSLGNRPPAG